MYHEIIIDSKTGNITEIKREFTVQELNKIEQDVLVKEQEINNKQSALNKLKALGLNDAEIKSIIE